MLVVGGYAVALAVVAVSALVSGDIRLLWRLTLFFELEEAAPGSLRRLLSGADEGPSATWPKVLVLLAAGGLWAWALWQSLRGPVAGRRPAADRGVRLLRVALYAQVACWLAYVIVPVWPWWAAVLDVLTLLAVAVAFYPVLRPAMGLAGLALFAGVSTNVLTIVDEVFDALDWHAAGRVVESSGLIGLTELIWLVVVLVAQHRDGRWQRATIGYGIAYMIGPIVLVLVGLPLRFVSGLENVYSEAVAVSAGVLWMIWIARSAHDLADPHSRPAPPRPLPLPLPARPHALAVTAWLTVAARLAACVIPIIPALVNLAYGHLLWITPHVPMEQLTYLVGDVMSTLWWVLELAAGAGGVAVLVLIAAHRGTRRTFRVAMTALLLTAAAGLTAVAGTTAIALFREGLSRGDFLTSGIDLGAPFGSGWGMEYQAMSPLWFTAACLVSAALLWWARVMRATPLDYGNRIPA
jgi:hypothetical protein